MLETVCEAGYHSHMQPAREQWEQCLAKLRASTRPDAAAIEEIIRALLGLPYPLDFCKEADAVGVLLCDICRLVRMIPLILPLILQSSHQQDSLVRAGPARFAGVPRGSERAGDDADHQAHCVHLGGEHADHRHLPVLRHRVYRGGWAAAQRALEGALRDPVREWAAMREPCGWPAQALAAVCHRPGDHTISCTRWRCGVAGRDRFAAAGASCCAQHLHLPAPLTICLLVARRRRWIASARCSHRLPSPLLMPAAAQRVWAGEVGSTATHVRRSLPGTAEAAVAVAGAADLGAGVVAGITTPQ